MMSHTTGRVLSLLVGICGRGSQTLDVGDTWRLVRRQHRRRHRRQRTLGGTAGRVWRRPWSWTPLRARRGSRERMLTSQIARRSTNAPMMEAVQYKRNGRPYCAPHRARTKLSMRWPGTRSDTWRFVRLTHCPSSFSMPPRGICRPAGPCPTILRHTSNIPNPAEPAVPSISPVTRAHPISQPDATKGCLFPGHVAGWPRTSSYLRFLPPSSPVRPWVASPGRPADSPPPLGDVCR